MNVDKSVKKERENQVKDPEDDSGSLLICGSIKHEAIAARIPCTSWNLFMSQPFFHTDR